MLGREVDGIFKRDADIQGLVVVEDNKPVGLLMKHKFLLPVGQPVRRSGFYGPPGKSDDG